MSRVSSCKHSSYWLSELVVEGESPAIGQLFVRRPEPDEFASAGSMGDNTRSYCQYEIWKSQKTVFQGIHAFTA